MVIEDRILLALLHFRRKHLVMQIGCAISGLDRAKSCRAMAGEMRRIRMTRVQRILLQPSKPLTIAISDIALRRLVMAGTRDEQRLACPIHAGRVGIALFRQPFGGRRLELAFALQTAAQIERIDMLLAHMIFVTGEIDFARVLIHADKAGDDPIAAGQLDRLAAIGAVEIKMAIAIAL